MLAASGGLVAISKLRPGDKVLATNTKTGKTQAEPVAAVLVHYDKDRYELKVRAAGHTSVIKTTRSHLFWNQTTGRWTKAGALNYGTHLRTQAGGTASVLGGYTPPVTTGWMWDLTVPGNNDHDFYIQTAATDVLVHNASCPVDLGNGTFRHSDGSIRDASGKFAGSDGTAVGAEAERQAWDQLETDGADVVRGRVSTTGNGGQTRIYDGALDLGNDKYLGIEVKSGGANDS